MASLIRNIYKYSRLIPTPLNMNLMYKYAHSSKLSDVITQAKFMKNEIPIRLARMSVKLNELPYGLSNNVHIQSVNELYHSSFDMIMKAPYPIDHEKAENLSYVLDKIKNRHSEVQEEIGRGIQEWTDFKDSNNDININFFLDKFYISRIGIRTLIGQYIGNFNNSKGVIHNCSPLNIIKDAIYRSKDICEMEYGDSPEVNISGCEDFTFNYIPSHIFYINFELLKNAMKATMDTSKSSIDCPDINITITEGTSDLIIKISDKGGGFSRKNTKKMFNYSYTTSKRTGITGTTGIGIENTRELPVMSGLGYGLPLSRLYCRYFYGDLQLISYEGIGTDAIIFINKGGQQEYVN